MATYAIGDIHGSLTALKTLFQQGLIQPTDKVVFLGDYVDKGPDSKGVLDWLIEHRSNYDFEFLLGNHDILMKNAKNSHVQFLEWMQYGGAVALDSYNITHNTQWMQKIDQSHWDFLDACQHYWEMDSYLFVHAGLESGKSLEEQDDHHLFWKKYKKPKAYDTSKTVICGHTSRKNGKIADFGHTICIDTYAHGGMWLTCLNVETGEFLKANNKGQVEEGQLQ